MVGDLRSFLARAHHLVLASTILHRPLYSNMAGDLRSFLARAMGLYIYMHFQYSSN